MQGYALEPTIEKVLGAILTWKPEIFSSPWVCTTYNVWYKVPWSNMNENDSDNVVSISPDITKKSRLLPSVPFNSQVVQGDGFNYKRFGLMVR